MNRELEPITQQIGEDEVEIDLFDLLFYLKEKLVFFIAALLIGAGIAGGITYFLITPTYQATSYLYMVSASSGSVIDLSDLNIGTSVATDYEQLLTRRPVLENIIEKLDEIVVDETGAAAETAKEGTLVLEDVTDLSKYITLSTLSDSRVLGIAVVTPYAELSKEIANEMADQATTFIPKIMNVTAPTVAEYAVTPTEWYEPSYTRNIAIGGLLGLVLLAGILIVLYVLDDSIKTSEDMERYFNIVPLAIVPEGKIEDAADHHHGYGKKKRRTAK